MPSKESYLIDSGYWNKCTGSSCLYGLLPYLQPLQKGSIFFISGCVKISGKMDIWSKSEEKGYFITLLITTARSGGGSILGIHLLLEKVGIFPLCHHYNFLTAVDLCNAVFSQQFTEMTHSRCVCV